MSIWFAAGNDGHLYNLCDCGDFEAAEESAKDVLPEGTAAWWIFDEDAARQWAEVLTKGITMNQKLKLSDLELPGEYRNEHQLYVRLNNVVDLQVKRTDEGFVVDLFQFVQEGTMLDSVATTWVHDNDLLPEDES